MNTKTLSNHALSIIDQYLHFKVGPAECSVPYFNNKTIRARAALRSTIGKGSPKEIYEEIHGIMIKNHIDASTLSNESLKRTLTDNNIGIDCSAFAYYVLNAECEVAKKGHLDKHIHFVNCHGLIGRVRCSLRPIENCDVATLANNKNSSVVRISNVVPGDIITMVGGPDSSDRDHILVIHQIDYQNFVPTKIHYTHAIAYPEDGIYGTGIRQGTIEILKNDAPITDQSWIEDGKTGTDNRLLLRAQKSRTELRRLNILC